MELAAQMPVDEFENSVNCKDLNQETVSLVYRTRVAALEKSNAKLQQSNETWEKKCQEIEDSSKKLSRDKETIKRTLDEIEAAWETKGPEARCIDPVHIYGPRNYCCEKCTRQVNTYIQSKVWYLLNRGSTWSGIQWPY